MGAKIIARCFACEVRKHRFCSSHVGSQTLI